MLISIRSRLRLAWCALWYGRIRFTITRFGSEQTKGYKHRWVEALEKPGEDFCIITAEDQMCGDAQSHEDLVAHYRDHFAGEDLQSEYTPIDPDIIDAVRDSPADPNDPEGPTIRDIAPPGSLHYMPHESMTDEERYAVMIEDWKRRQPKKR